MAGIVSAATILRGFSGYLQVLVSVPDVLVIPLLVLLLGGLAVWGIVESVAVAAIFTGIGIAGLLLIIWVAAPGLLQSQPVVTDFMPLLEPDVWYGVFAGSFLAFYAFIGFEDMVNVAEEVRRPEVNLPRAILTALELILPEGNRIFRLENMLDMDGNPVKEAPGGGYRVQIPLDGQGYAMGLLARYL